MINIYDANNHSPDLMIDIASGERYNFIKDQLGSILSVLTQNNQSKQQLRYDVFGAVTQDTNPGFQPFGFAGGHYDFETGLVRFGARDYDADTGRWLVRDPIRFQGGDTNLYGYVNGDPVNKIDPSGNGPVLGAVCAVVAGATVVAVLGTASHELNTKLEKAKNDYNNNMEEIDQSDSCITDKTYRKAKAAVAFAEAVAVIYGAGTAALGALEICTALPTP